MEFALADLGSYPKYYRYMADINRRGPDVLGSVPRLASLTALSAHHQIEEGAVLLDTQPQREFNQGHIPGAFAIPFNNWILAQFPSGGGEPVMLALASVAAQVPALGVAQGWCPC